MSRSRTPTTCVNGSSPGGFTPRNNILVGDALDHLSRLEAASIDAVVTSPPYYRLRDYGHAGQLGLESSVDAFVEQLRQVSSGIARVLVPTGTYWLNLGDTYSTHMREGAARKGLIGVPERVLLALMADGWLVRNKIIWAKTNPIPTSVTDRLATTYEVIYVLARSPRYFFDLDEIRETHATSSRRPRQGSRRQGLPVRRDPGRPAWRGPNADGDSGLTRLRDAGITGHPLGKNPGDVWRLATSRYRGAHFATYPESLAERMIRASTPEARCTQCRAPWTRPLRRTGALGAVAVRLALAPTCTCGATSEPGLVLDPFLGSGTTAIAAEALHRDWLGIELNPDYAELARQRLTEQRRKRGEPGLSPP